MLRIERIKKTMLALACGVAMVSASSIAMAEPAGLQFDTKPYHFATAEQARVGDGKVQASHVVQAHGAEWLRLRFEGVQLQPGSTLVITSMLDGAQQHLNAETLRQWRNTSAYFNGEAVRVELIAADGTSGNRFGIRSLMVGKPPVQTESQCGPVDNRVASTAAARGRLLDVGCTANLMTSGCFITAGHCMSSPSLVDVVEFNVPDSTSSGALRHPPPSDQYVPTNSRQFLSNTIGKDWGVFTVFPNTQTGLMPIDVEGPGLEFATSLPAKGSTVEIVGYGVDTGTANQTEQVSTGPITAVKSAKTRLNYQADTEGGNSGSAVLSAGKVVGIHTNGGCSASGGSGANSGTLYTNPQLQSAVAAICGSAR